MDRTATYVKVRAQGREFGRIVSVAVTVGRGRQTATVAGRCWAWISARRRAETFWTGFLRKLTRRGLRGVKLVGLRCPRRHQGRRLEGADGHLQRCRVHFMRNNSGPCRTQRTACRLGLRRKQHLRRMMPRRKRAGSGVSSPISSGQKVPKRAALMDEAEHDVLAYMSFPQRHCTKLHSTNPLERLKGEIKRRTDVVRHLPKRSGHHPPRRRNPARTER